MVEIRAVPKVFGQSGKMMEIGWSWEGGIRCGAKNGGIGGLGKGGIHAVGRLFDRCGKDDGISVRQKMVQSGLSLGKVERRWGVLENGGIHGCLKWKMVGLDSKMVGIGHCRKGGDQVRSKGRWDGLGKMVELDAVPKMVRCGESWEGWRSEWWISAVPKWWDQGGAGRVEIRVVLEGVGTENGEIGLVQENDGEAGRYRKMVEISGQKSIRAVWEDCRISAVPKWWRSGGLGRVEIVWSWTVVRSVSKNYGLDAVKVVRSDGVGKSRISVVKWWRFVQVPKMVGLGKMVGYGDYWEGVEISGCLRKGWSWEMVGLDAVRRWWRSGRSGKGEIHAVEGVGSVLKMVEIDGLGKSVDPNSCKSLKGVWARCGKMVGLGESLGKWWRLGRLREGWRSGAVPKMVESGTLEKASGGLGKMVEIRCGLERCLWEAVEIRASLEAGRCQNAGDGSWDGAKGCRDSCSAENGGMGGLGKECWEGYNQCGAKRRAVGHQKVEIGVVWEDDGIGGYWEGWNQMRKMVESGVEMRASLERRAVGAQNGGMGGRLGKMMESGGYGNGEIRWVS
ncbi:hypothetical protein AAG906_023655 [Vitis piasezkii]